MIENYDLDGVLSSGFVLKPGFFLALFAVGIFALIFGYEFDAGGVADEVAGSAASSVESDEKPALVWQFVWDRNSDGYQHV